MRTENKHESKITSQTKLKSYGKHTTYQRSSTSLYTLFRCSTVKLLSWPTVQWAWTTVECMGLKCRQVVPATSPRRHWSAEWAFIDELERSWKDNLSIIEPYAEPRLVEYPFLRLDSPQRECIRPTRRRSKKRCGEPDFLSRVRNLISISAFYGLPLFAPFWDWRKSQRQKSHKQTSQVKIPTNWSIPKLDFALALSRCNISYKL